MPSPCFKGRLRKIRQLYRFLERTVTPGEMPQLPKEPGMTGAVAQGR